jgi:Calcineurin-like phosphoesterase
VTGNHEYSGVSLSSFWAPQFPYPDNGPAWGDEPALDSTAYYVDYQGVRFIGLNTNVQSIPQYRDEQTKWLEGLLKDNPNKWTVVTFHHPVYSTAEGRLADLRVALRQRAALRRCRGAQERRRRAHRQRVAHAGHHDR